MSGPLIYSFSQDAVAAAKVVAEFAKTNDKLVIRAGAYGGKALDVNGVKQLASIPSKQVLLAQLLGLMQSPHFAYSPCAGRIGGTAWRGGSSCSTRRGSGGLSLFCLVVINIVRK